MQNSHNHSSVDSDFTINLLEDAALFFTSFIWTLVVIVFSGLMLLMVAYFAGEDQIVNAFVSLIDQTGLPEKGAEIVSIGDASLRPTPLYIVTYNSEGQPAFLPEGELPAETPIPPAPPSLAPSQTPTATTTISASTIASAAADKVATPEPSTNFNTRPEPSPPGSPIRLVIPSIKVDSRVIPVGWLKTEKEGKEISSWEVANYAVGWHKTSALPGQVGNVVLAGHHNVKGEVFRYLVNVQIGDEIDIYTGDKEFRYVVDYKTVVKEKGEPVEVRYKNAEWIMPTTDERLTLVSCWPYTDNTHRVIIVAKPQS